MNTMIKNILTSWESSLIRFQKIDSWNYSENLATLGWYLHNNDCTIEEYYLIKYIRDSIIGVNFNVKSVLNAIQKLMNMEAAKEKDLTTMLVKMDGNRVVLNGQDVRFKKETDTENTREPIMKVRDLNSFYVEGNEDFSLDYSKGLFVDIFPMIDYPNVSRAFCRKYGKDMSRCYSILHHSHQYSWRAVAELFYFGARYQFCKLMWKAAFAFKRTGTYMSNILINNGYGIMHRRDSIFPLGTIEFEGKRFSAPANTDAYLHDLYRDYMQIPPKEKQKIHSVFILPELIKQ